MPRRKDIKKIMVIGSGPIIIGQACEFDYSGTQAVKALKEEGYKVILVNSNPATIMTDPEMADRTYIEPLAVEICEKIIEKERPDALLPTMGGQTALNLTVLMATSGVLERYSVELIGAKLEAIQKAEDRELFKKAMLKIGIELPKSGYAGSVEEALRSIEEIGYPAIVRPSFTLGGTGGNIAYNIDELKSYVEWGLSVSPINKVLIEESVIGWKEYELEVMRDLKDNVVIICSIENFDPMGVHTGDSITVAPAQTLTDCEYQMMRDAAIAIMREIGVETGGSNIQFAVNPKNGKMVVIEMNPRVSRSSALASKATGFPIAKIAAKLAVGYTLDEIANDITRKTPACFEPTIDYVVVKIPRWDFEKFPEAKPYLTTQMKSVGEAMAIGRTFMEALQKALRSLENDRMGLGCDGEDIFPDTTSFSNLSAEDKSLIREKLLIPNPERIFFIRYALRAGFSVEEIATLSGIDPWFLYKIAEIVEFEQALRCKAHLEKELDFDTLYKAKRYGFSDHQLATIFNKKWDEVRNIRKKFNIKPVYKVVDTCAGEFEAFTPYFYSTYEPVCEAAPRKNKKVAILGSGPNRIGQGIEFDYCCVHSAMALREIGYEAIMINCNPETVSTDYDISDRLYFEPLTAEDVLNILELEKPEGVILQFGGQTPLKLAADLQHHGFKILGTSPDAIDRAEDRKRFQELVKKLGLLQPPSGTALSLEEAEEIAEDIGYPVLVRPSYVLGGRGMEIIYDIEQLRHFLGKASKMSSKHPVLIDKFLEDAIEIDVDAISDGEKVVIGGIMEHIEEAGIHSGDSCCVLPPYTLAEDELAEIGELTKRISLELGVIGLINLQMAIKNERVYILEVNPRASRTIPFVSKATGVPLAKIATKILLGYKLTELGLSKEVKISHTAVKKPVFPFVKFPGVDCILGPEMRSTGESMGIDWTFGGAFLRAAMDDRQRLPDKGTVLISVRNRDKRSVIFLAKKLKDLGFKILATRGTAQVLSRNGIDAEIAFKVNEGRPNIVDRMKNRDIHLVINTPEGRSSHLHSSIIRQTAMQLSIPYFTTLSGASAAINAIESIRSESLEVRAIQDYMSIIRQKLEF